MGKNKGNRFKQKTYDEGDTYEKLEKLAEKKGLQIWQINSNDLDSNSEVSEEDLSREISDGEKEHLDNSTNVIDDIQNNEIKQVSNEKENTNELIVEEDEEVITTIVSNQLEENTNIKLLEEKEELDEKKYEKYIKNETNLNQEIKVVHEIIESKDENKYETEADYESLPYKEKYTKDIIKIVKKSDYADDEDIIKRDKISDEKGKNKIKFDKIQTEFEYPIEQNAPDNKKNIVVDVIKDEKKTKKNRKDKKKKEEYSDDEVDEEMMKRLEEARKKREEHALLEKLRKEEEDERKKIKREEEQKQKDLDDKNKKTKKNNPKKKKK